jgi:hypothetical protein
MGSVEGAILEEIAEDARLLYNAIRQRTTGAYYTKVMRHSLLA